MPRKNKAISHQPYTTNMLSCDKGQYRTADDAQKAAELRMLENMNLELAVYQCDSCLHWHLTRSVGDKPN